MCAPDDATIAEFTATIASLKEQLAAGQASFAAIEAEIAAAQKNWSSEKAAFIQTIASASAAKTAGTVVLSHAVCMLLFVAWRLATMVFIATPAVFRSDCWRKSLHVPVLCLPLR